MSKARPPRIYWDACLFLDLVNKTPGRIDTLATLWDDLLGAEPQAEAITSMLTIAEVAFATQEQTSTKLDEDMLARIEGFWAPPPDSPIQLVELYEGIARDARDLIRRAVADGHSLKAHDAIHFATAKRWNATRFLTYDARLYKFSNKFGFPVEAPVVTGKLNLTEALTPVVPTAPKEHHGTEGKASSLAGAPDGRGGAPRSHEGEPSEAVAAAEAAEKAQAEGEAELDQDQQLDAWLAEAEADAAAANADAVAEALDPGDVKATKPPPQTGA